MATTAEGTAGNGYYRRPNRGKRRLYQAVHRAEENGREAQGGAQRAQSQGSSASSAKRCSSSSAYQSSTHGQHTGIQTGSSACSSASSQDQDRRPKHQPPFFCKPGATVTSSRTLSASRSTEASFQSTSSTCGGREVCPSTSCATKQSASLIERCKSRSSTSTTAT